MTETETSPRALPADSALPGLLALLPDWMQPYALLARLDRPVGIWLLFLPCLIGLLFVRMRTGLYLVDFLWAPLFLIGAIAMRGAGCTWNDISDRDFDAQVSRTALRPLPSGAVTLSEAYIFMGAQLFVGGLVWLCLPADAKISALCALPLVAAYPFMKRITWWPQAWLGLTFNWGILVGAATAGSLSGPVIILYAALILWTLAYDTIYALQDREDDALIGVRSTARLFGKRAVLISFSFHMGAAALIALAAWVNGSQRAGAVTALAFLAHGLWQAARLKSSREADALAVFKSNVFAGALVAIGFLLAAMLPTPQPRSLFADHEILPAGPSSKVELPFGLEVKREPHIAGEETWMASDIVRALESEGVEVPEE
ncbi:4-hydroxybenzoate octaprenyltransferase [Hyphomonas johnsonii]|uniref:4-hydroxybenzoate octaprenyltransferase n=1 Tax=Hyphomonas johnsonii MHS-2 TaxID=1280950 RepID=A0A059FTM0_9PROT|nr:4-hydroxybenzoate octaprenyltransferase [Hyphomonas johnsonii]KCZ93861.1 4-hydroxybenzoate polyprenyltransferase [Hyphomonas johnsonii MHS-2]